jgi:hypothetical protein
MSKKNNQTSNVIKNNNSRSYENFTPLHWQESTTNNIGFKTYQNNTLSKSSYSIDKEGTYLQRIHNFLQEDLNLIENFKDNWDGEGSLKISEKVIQNTREILKNFKSLIPDDEKLVSLIPSPYGTISIDLSNRQGDEISIEVGKTKFAYFTEYVKGDNVLENDIQLNQHILKIKSLLEKLYRK